MTVKNSKDFLPGAEIKWMIVLLLLILYDASCVWNSGFH